MHPLLFVPGHYPKYRQGVHLHAFETQEVFDIRNPSSRKPAFLEACVEGLDSGFVFFPLFLVLCTDGNAGIDTRVFDFTVYDETGSTLCFMNRFELRRNVVVSAPRVDRRYEMISQPVLPAVPSPRLKPTWAREREDKAKRTNLLQTLDRLAYEMLQKSLEEDIQVGEKIDRKRYEEFARSVVARSDPPAPIPHDVEAMKQEWPAPFEITERVANVHKDVFGSSTVRFLICQFGGTPLISIDRQLYKHSSRMT